MSYWEDHLQTFTFAPEVDSICRKIIEAVGHEVEKYKPEASRTGQALFNVQHVRLDKEFLDVSRERIERIMVELREFYKEFYTVHKQGIIHVTWEPILEWECDRGPPGMIQLKATRFDELRRPHLYKETHHTCRLCSIL